jgi:hypothetical protein
MHQALALVILIVLVYYIEQEHPGKWMDVLVAGTGALGAIVVFGCCKHALKPSCDYY